MALNTAWDIAVTLMERGEVAKIKSAARFAYGECGKVDKIPGNATITYELELLEVHGPVEFASLMEEELVTLV
jgi:FK506-binding protein 8